MTERRFSKLDALHLVVAACLVALIDLTLRKVYAWGESDVPIVGALYAVKLGLAVGVRRRIPSILLYTLASAAALVMPLRREWHNPHVTPVGLYLCVPLILLTLPTLSFVFDLIRPSRPRVLIWRSVFEIGVVYPFWAYGAAYVSIFYLGGWWI